MNVSPHLQGSLNNLLDIRIDYSSLRKATFGIIDTGNVDPAFHLSEQLGIPQKDFWSD
jgi:hypothetical protein